MRRHGMVRGCVAAVTGVIACLAAADGWAVYQCDGQKDDCLCGKDNPFPCCSNGGNCTWWAWEAACCNWGSPALPTYGDAWHWKTEALAAGWPMRSTPKVGTVFVRTVGGGDCGGHDCGHVGWVVSVDGNGGFCATEMACWGWYGVETKCHSAGYADGGFICKKGTACEDAPSCTTEVGSGGETVIDDQNGCFQRYGTPAYWWEASIGYAGHMWYTYATDDPTDNYGVWTLNVRDAGNYEVFAYIPENNATTHQAKYRIRHNGKETTVTVNQNAISAQFTSLGTHDFAAGGNQWVRLDDSTGEDYETYKRKVGFDAVKMAFRPSCVPNCSGKQCGDDGCGGSCGSCQDGNPCTNDSCSSGQCQFIPNSSPCNDGNACTVGDACAGGACSGSPMDCSGAGDACNEGVCQGGVCVKSPKSGPCDDGNACTVGDACTGGVCSGSVDPCLDDDPCTLDTCNPALGCAHEPIPGCCSLDADCDDGLQCTVDLCVEMVCLNAAADPFAGRTCLDGDSYWTDSCGATSEMAEDCGPCGCEAGECVQGDCAGRECGDDGCAGTCGECAPGMVCVEDREEGTSSCRPFVDGHEPDPEVPDAMEAPASEATKPPAPEDGELSHPGEDGIETGDGDSIDPGQNPPPEHADAWGEAVPDPTETHGEAGPADPGFEPGPSTSGTTGGGCRSTGGARTSIAPGVVLALMMAAAFARRRTPAGPRGPRPRTTETQP